MGAWGAGSFENDTAIDWAAGVQSVDDVRRPFAQLKQDTDAYTGKGELVVDSDFACELLAAAECVAAMLGRRSRDFPEDLAQRLSGARRTRQSAVPSGPQRRAARDAQFRARRTVGRGRRAARRERMACDSDRSDRPAQSRNRSTNGHFCPVLRVIGAIRREIVATCAFCNRPIERQHLWSMHVDDAYNPGRAGKKSYELHLPCLNSRLHHKHAIADFKFDPDNMPDLDQL